MCFPWSLGMKLDFKRRNIIDKALALIAARFKSLSEHTRLKLIIASEEGEKM
jgi:hypothetical protein